jgi:hypothetical protein
MHLDVYIPSTEASWPLFLHNVNDKRKFVDSPSLQCLIAKSNSRNVTHSKLASFVMFLICDGKCHV